MERYEVFMDVSYYGMWCVRPIGSQEFNSFRHFHFVLEDDARKFKELIEKAR